MSPRLEAVLFDADQTLWDFQQMMRRALTAVLAELQRARPGHPAASLTFGDLVADRTAATVEDPEELDLGLLRRRGFIRTLERLGLEDGGLAVQLAASYFHHRDAHPGLFDDTIGCLDELRGRYRLGVLSNGSRLPERCGLGDRFDVTVFAQNHGASKPDRRLFDRACSLIGVTADRCVLVGDDPRNDVVGAKGAGWRAVWLDRVGGGVWDPDLPGTAGVVPDAVIISLRQLPPVLEVI